MQRITYTQGNTFSVAIPMVRKTIDKNGSITTITTEDFTPSEGDVVEVRLIGQRRTYTYTPRIEENIAVVDMQGNELAGHYGIEVVVVTAIGERMRFADPHALELVPFTGEVDNFVVGSVELEASVFFAMSGAKGDKGDRGDDGNGIVSIVKTGTQGLVDTYTITMTNGTTYTYQVTNGKDGQDGTDGVGIVSITKTSTSGLVDTYTILLTNGTTTTFQVTNGSDATQVQSDWSQNDSTAVDYIKNKPTIPDAQIQADWSQTTNTAKDYIKNKPTIPAAQVQSDWNEASTSSKAYIQNKPTIPTIPATATQSEINAGSSTSQRTFTPQLFHDNAYIVEESYSSGSLKANKFYDFGTVSSALTIPSLDATNDLVSNALNFYALRFVAGADNISITFPTGVIVDDTPTINTGDYVEIMINLYVENNTNHFYASIKVWRAQ